jgi:hypothetical protein
MDRVQALVDRACAWYEHSPTAQRAYERFCDDVSVVAARVEPTVSQLWERIAPLIDPPAKADGKKGTE